jgi:hypothetical protein
MQRIILTTNTQMQEQKSQQVHKTNYNRFNTMNTTAMSFQDSHKWPRGASPLSLLVNVADFNKSAPIGSRNRAMLPMERGQRKHIDKPLIRNLWGPSNLPYLLKKIYGRSKVSALSSSEPD